MEIPVHVDSALEVWTDDGPNTKQKNVFNRLRLIQKIKTTLSR